jgi:hypothetical protein
VKPHTSCDGHTEYERKTTKSDAELFPPRPCGAVNSPNEGDDAAAVARVVVKLFEVAFVVLGAAGANVAKCKEGKRARDRVPARDGPARPFEDFTKKIGARDELEAAAARDLVAGFTGFAQAGEDVVRLDVDRHAGEEEGDAHDEARVEEIRRTVVLRRAEVRHLRQVSALRIAVHGAEDKRREAQNRRSRLACVQVNRERSGWQEFTRSSEERQDDNKNERNRAKAAPPVRRRGKMKVRLK